MAGSSFLRARSPVTPNMTSTHGPATRGIRRSRASRSGLSWVCWSSMAWGLAGAAPRLPGPAVTDSLTTLFFLRYVASIRQRRALGPRTLLLAELALDRLDELVPGCGELSHALIFQHLDDIVVGDTQLLQVGKD